MALHINLEDLLSARTVESDRIEFKEGWNPDSIYRSICAFANDFDNTGGGYILIGVAENPVLKTAIRPVKGLTTKEIGELQKEMIGYDNLFKPYYSPRLFIEDVDGEQIVVLWVLAGSERPYEVPESVKSKNKNWKYFIRKYASSIEAKGTDKEELMALTNNIPFDDRPNSHAELVDISMFRLRDYLVKVKSKLADEVGKRTDREILSQMELISGPPEHVFPRNVALMLFTDKPHTFFPYTWVEVVYFPRGAGDKEFIEKIIEGPVQQQITDALSWLKANILQEKVTKVPGQAEAIRVWNYPYAALEEAVANCIFHRNYQEREPVRIRIEPDAILLYNSGGPDRSIKREDFTTGRVIPKRYRNRRLGDFLKELKLTEGHATGLPALIKAIQQNGSPMPVFDFDDERTWFQVLLPIHPAFKIKLPFAIDLSKVNWNMEGIDNLLKQILEYAEIDESGGIAGGIAGEAKNIDNQLITPASSTKSDIVNAIAGDVVGDVAGVTVKSDNQTVKNIINIIGDVAGDVAGGIAGGIAGDIAKIYDVIDNQAIALMSFIADDIVDDIAGGIAGGIAKEHVSLLNLCKKAMLRDQLFQYLNLAKHPTNFKLHIKPLVAINWLTMTIPNKPTSPKQQYLTTLKGRLILEFLKHKTK